MWVQVLFCSASKAICEQKATLRELQGTLWCHPSAVASSYDCRTHQARQQQAYSGLLVGARTSTVTPKYIDFPCFCLLPSCCLQVKQAFTNYRSRAWAADQQQLRNAYDQGKLGKVHPAVVGLH